MFEFIFVIVIYILLIAGAVILQIFLSKRPSRWPGLVLPLLSLVLSLVIVFGLYTFTAIENTTVVTQNSSGTVVTEYKENTKTISEGTVKEEILFQVVVVFLITNIPTFISFGIYLACHENEKVKLVE